MGAVITFALLFLIGAAIVVVVRYAQRQTLTIYGILESVKIRNKKIEEHIKYVENFEKNVLQFTQQYEQYQVYKKKYQEIKQKYKENLAESGNLTYCYDFSIQLSQCETIPHFVFTKEKIEKIPNQLYEFRFYLYIEQFENAINAYKKLETSFSSYEQKYDIQQRWDLFRSGTVNNLKIDKAIQWIIKRANKLDTLLVIHISEKNNSTYNIELLLKTLANILKDQSPSTRYLKIKYNLNKDKKDGDYSECHDDNELIKKFDSVCDLYDCYFVYYVTAKTCVMLLDDEKSLVALFSPDLLFELLSFLYDHQWVNINQDLKLNLPQTPLKLQMFKQPDYTNQTINTNNNTQINNILDNNLKN